MKIKSFSSAKKLPVNESFLQKTRSQNKEGRTLRFSGGKRKRPEIYPHNETIPNNHNTRKYKTAEEDKSKGNEINPHGEKNLESNRSKREHSEESKLNKKELSFEKGKNLKGLYFCKAFH